MKLILTYSQSITSEDQHLAIIGIEVDVFGDINSGKN